MKRPPGHRTSKVGSLAAPAPWTRMTGRGRPRAAPRRGRPPGHPGPAVAGLSVLPLAGPADGAPDPPPEPWVVRNVLEVARTTYRVVDLPATEGPSAGAALSQADAPDRRRPLRDRWRPRASGGPRDMGRGRARSRCRRRRRNRCPAPGPARPSRGPRHHRRPPLGPHPRRGRRACRRRRRRRPAARPPRPAAVQAMVTLANRVVPFAAVSP